MKIKMSMTNLGIEFAVSPHNGSDKSPLEPAADVNQENPRRSYVYAHLDATGKIFYIGKGVGRRAWSPDRHPLWHRYVGKHLEGHFQVRILRDNLSEQEAEEVEAAWIAQCSADLVNWVNMGRVTNLQALAQFHKLRDANRDLILQAKIIEKSNPEQAAIMYVQAIEAIKEYAFIDYEEGLVGQLLSEEDDEFGKNGEIEALDRLTMCLINLNRSAEAVQYTNNYFTLYRRDMEQGTYPVSYTHLTLPTN